MQTSLVQPSEPSGLYVSKLCNSQLWYVYPRGPSAQCSGTGSLKDPGIPKIHKVRPKVYNNKQKSYTRKSVRSASKLGQQIGLNMICLQIPRNSIFSILIFVLNRNVPAPSFIRDFSVGSSVDQEVRFTNFSWLALTLIKVIQKHSNYILALEWFQFDSNK